MKTLIRIVLFALIAMQSPLAAGELRADDEIDVGALLRRLEAAEQRLKDLEAKQHGNESRDGDAGVVTIDDAPSSMMPETVAPLGFHRDEHVLSASRAAEFEINSASRYNSDRNSRMSQINAASYEVDYDSGFVIRPIDKNATPYELQINGRMQFRYVNFARSANYYSNQGNAARGGPMRISNRNDFEIERGRLVFSGFVYDPNLQFFLNLDGDTDDNHQVIVHDFWFNYKFSDEFDLYMGKAFVPGSRAWLDGSTRTHLADRSMATTFFRPDRSLGIWAIGEFAENAFYRAMIANGFATSDLRFSEIDSDLTYSGSMWWDPIGDYGNGYADLEWHEEPAVRVGQSFTFASHTDLDERNIPLAEQNYVRISDGTRLILPGALAPGVTVLAADIYLYAIDAAFKFQGWSLNSELYFRWLNEFDTIGGPSPHSQLYDGGFYLDAGYMFVEKKLEAVGRTSFVDGFYGERWEYAGGINWYVNGTHHNKVTLDFTVLDGNPVSNSGPDYVVGQTGLLTRLQWQIAY